MLLLDTNVVAEVMRRSPEPAVVAWLAEQAPERVHLSTVTIAEIHHGLSSLADADRRRGAIARFERFVDEGFDGRVLDFDRLAAEQYGLIRAGREAAGRPISVPDAQIAATARSERLRLATRNVARFDNLGLDLFDPFDLASPST